MSFKVGDKVRVHPDIGTPAYEWGNVRPGDIGVVTQLISVTLMVVDFPNHVDWNADPRDMELVESPKTRLVKTSQGAMAGHVVEDILSHLTKDAKARKGKRKSPDKVLAYGILNRDGKLTDITQDRDYARLLKAHGGGKKEGVTIVVLKADKEIR